MGNDDNRMFFAVQQLVSVSGWGKTGSFFGMVQKTLEVSLTL
jgi:hypothetical protein